MDNNQEFHKILKKYWGYDCFRENQLEIIQAVISGSDILALMPTGGGKSLLYQLPALSMEGVCIVVTPLIALMKDQVDRLRKRDISAAAIHSGLTRRQIDITLDNACWGDLKFLYVSPERLTDSTFRDRLRTMNVNILAVDEAHCISQWGYDFRPSYLSIAELRDILTSTPVLALTASAIPEVASDIMRHLRMNEGRVIRSSFARRNLSFAVRTTDDKNEQLLRVINNVPGSGIVYVRTREETEKLSQWLTENGIVSAAYHAGISYNERNKRQEDWSKGLSRVMVSTNAFGMGIDKADVRFVIHYDTCDSLEAYYQEAGRAGRDGKRAYAVLLCGSDDSKKALKRFETEFPPIERIKDCYEQLFNYLQIGIGDGKYASFAFNIYEFASRVRMHTSTIHNCLKILQQNGYLSLTDETDNPPRILFLINRDNLYKIRIEREELDHIIRTILRLYEGLFGDRLISVDEHEISHASGYTVAKVRELMQKLWQQRIIKYVPANRSPILFINEERLPVKDVYISPESYNMRKVMYKKRIEAMFSYSSDTKVCRSVFFQEYFGEENPDDCGVCDVCINKKQKEKYEHYSSEDIEADSDLNSSVLKLANAGTFGVKEIIGKFNGNPDKIINIIDALHDEGIIYTGSDGKIRRKG